MTHPQTHPPRIEEPTGEENPSPESQEEVSPATARLSMWGVVKKTVQRWASGNAPTQSAALAFYTLFSLGPLMVLVVAVAGNYFGDEAMHREITQQVRLLFGNQSARTMAEFLDSAVQASANEGIGLLGVLGLLLGATAVFGQLQEALNAIWNVKVERGNLIRDFFTKRLLSFTLIVIIGFLLLVSLVISAGLSALTTYSEQVFHISKEVLSLGQSVISMLILILLFAMIFRILPDAEIAWRDVAVGATATALLFALGKFLIGLYIGRSDIASPYGVAGSLVLLLMWIYYSTMVLLLGAGFTRVWSQRRRGGGEAPPSPGAETRDLPAKAS